MAEYHEVRRTVSPQPGEKHMPVSVDPNHLRLTNADDLDQNDTFSQGIIAFLKKL